MFDPYVIFHILIKFNCVAAYWEKAAHSADDMFSWYKYLSVNSSVFEVGISS